MVPNSEAGRKYDRLVALQGESDNGDSEFETSDEDKEDRDRDVTLRNGRRFPYGAYCAGVGHFNDLEEEEAIVFDAVTRASLRDPVNEDASTSAGSAGRIRTAFSPVHRLEGFTVDSDIVPDDHSEDEVLVLTDSVDRGKNRYRLRDELQATVTVPAEYDVDGIHRGYVSEGGDSGEGRGPHLVDEEEGRTSKYELGTHIDLAAGFRFVCRQWPITVM